ncbi:hypothetical protein Rhopal_004456-T1 [Rhodotorula paludigena]|uniref:Uncharacterized protein n=1 Tax=Rhodotorula paludigena TaxID=86838 RepID=A0AAV5GNH1_9BASI|nr:hypothetical protein Rhopal_004456-T1 [Rhodotorula paludigena]
MPLLSKPTIFFISLNLLRLLSVVAICLVFSAEIYTIDSDIRGMHEAEKAAASPSTTASTRIVRRSHVPAFPSTSSYQYTNFDSPSPTARPVALPVQTSKGFERVHRALQRRRQLARRERSDELAARLSPRAEEDADERSASATTSTTRRATKTSTSEAGVTATNLPLGAVEAAAEKQCKYIGTSSIPKGAAGALFSTLERIFAATILLLALLSELPPPFPPLSRPAVLLQQLWTSFFPPFGQEYGVGVLGAVQIFVGCQVFTTGWVQVSAWFLFLVGILNFLMGLALGARLKVLRSLSKDSTTPSALRKLRLQREAEHSSSAPSEKDGGGAWAHSHAYEQFDRAGGDEARPATAAAEQRRSFLPASFSRFSLKPSRRAPAPPTTAGAKRSPSRNGPNGIVIGAPLPLGGGAAGKGVSVPPPVYQYGRE